ncbi:MAG: hypothetical protein AAFN10_21325 [Bacteroidota bacterium]
MRSKPLFFLALCAILAIQSCRLNPAEGLRWDTDLLAPIAKSEVGLSDLIPDSLIQVDGDQLISLVLRDTFASTRLIDLIELPDTSVNITVSLDSLVLASDTISQSITLGEIARQLQGQGNTAGDLILGAHGSTLPLVPAVNDITSGPIEIDASEFFQNAVLDSGELVLTIQNELPLAIEDVILNVSNQNLPGPAIVVDTFDRIDPGQSITRTYDLAGTEIESQLIGELVNLNVAAGLLVPIDTTDFIQVILVAQNLQAQTATAIFPEQGLLDTTRQTEYIFPSEFSDIRLTKLVVKSGKIEAQTESTIEDSILFSYSLPGATNAQGEVPKVALKIDPAIGNMPNIQTAEASLGGFTMDLSGGSLGANTLQEQIKVSLLFSGNVTTLDRDDYVSVSFGLTEIEPTYVEGFIGRDIFRFSGQEAIDLFDELDIDKLKFTQPRAELVFANSIGLDAQVEINDLLAINDNTNTQTQLVGSPILAGPLTVAGPNLPDTNAVILTRLPFDVGNSNIDDFINILATELRYDLSLITNFNQTPQQLDNFATDDSEVAAYVEFTLPLEGQIGGLRLEDTVDVNFADSGLELENIAEAELTLILENQFPLEVEVFVDLLDETKRSLEVPLEGTRIAAGIVDASGRVLQSNKSEFKVKLTQSEWEEVRNRGRFLIVRYEMNTQPGDEAVALYDDYKILMRLVAGIRYQLEN